MSIDMNMPILVVDDFDLRRTEVRSLLEEFGFTNIEEAICAADALTMLRNKDREQKVGLVVSKFLMREMDGLCLLRTIRNLADLKDTPFIMVMRENESHHAAAVFDAGISGNIFKPYDTAIWRSHLERMFGLF